MIDAQSFRASPSPDRITRLQSKAGKFLSSTDPPASTWLSLLGMLSSLSHLVPGGRLRMRSLQLCLHRSWDRVDQSTRIPWSQDCLHDLRWWLHLPRLSQGVSLLQVSPDLDFWSDTSDVGWGKLTASGLWSHEESLLSKNARELLAVHRGLLHFQSSLVGRTISVFCDSSTAVSYLRKEGGTRSPFLNSLEQGILRWAESLSIRLAPQFILGSLNALADTVASSPTAPYRVVPQSGGLSILRSSVAGPSRLVCYLRKSPMLDLFLSLPGSDGCRHGRVPPTMGRSSSLRVSSLVYHSQGAGEAPGISGRRFSRWWLCIGLN